MIYTIAIFLIDVKKLVRNAPFIFRVTEFQFVLQKDLFDTFEHAYTYDARELLKLFPV